MSGVCNAQSAGVGNVIHRVQGSGTSNAQGARVRIVLCAVVSNTAEFVS